MITAVLLAITSILGLSDLSLRVLRYLSINFLYTYSLFYLSLTKFFRMFRDLKLVISLAIETMVTDSCLRLKRAICLDI